MSTVLERVTTVNDLLREVQSGGGGGNLPPVNLRKTGGGGDDDKQPNGRRSRTKSREGKPRKAPPLKKINYDPNWKDFDFIPESSKEEYEQESEQGLGMLRTVKLNILQEKLLAELFRLKAQEETTDTREIDAQTAEVMKRIAELRKQIAEAREKQMKNKLAEMQAQTVTAAANARSAALEAVERSITYGNEQTYANVRIERELVQARRAVEQVQGYRQALTLERGVGGSYRYNAASFSPLEGFPADRINELMESFGFETRFNNDRFGQGGYRR